MEDGKSRGKRRAENQSPDRGIDNRGTTEQVRRVLTGNLYCYMGIIYMMLLQSTDDEPVDIASRYPEKTPERGRR